MDVAESIRKWKFYISLLTRKETNSFNSFAYLLFIIWKVGLRICQWILRIGYKLSSDNILSQLDVLLKFLVIIKWNFRYRVIISLSHIAGDSSNRWWWRMCNDTKIMGQRQTKNTSSFGDTGNEIPPEVSFDDFEVLRAIGRGAFGKVIIR